MNWFHTLSAKSKLLFSFLAVSTTMGGVAGYAIFKMGEINNSTRVVFNEQLVPIAALGNTQVVAANLMHIGTISALKSEKSRRQKDLEYIENAKKEFAALYDGIVVPVASTPEEKIITVKVKEHFARFCNEAQELTQLAIQGKQTEGTNLLTEFFASGEMLLNELDEQTNLNEGYAKEGLKLSESSYNGSFWLVSGLVLVGSLFSLSIGWLISRWFTKALLEVSAIAENVATASQQLAAAAEELSSGAQEQASSLEETASSLEEITGTVQRNSDNAQQANQLACNSRRVAENGGEVVGKAVQGMSEITVASKKIAEIISAIDEIAFQTNLLALNAAVEAARAGEQGRGFAVVAGEVRTLAQRSAGAAKEIKSLIQDSVSKVEVGSDLVNKSGHTLNEIVGSVKRVTDIVAEIAAASREQAIGIDQVNQAVTQMDHIVQTNAAQTEELTSTADGLASQARQLQELVSQFNLTNRVEKTRTAFIPAAPRAVTRPASRRPQNAHPVTTGRKKNFDDTLETQLEQELEFIGANSESGIQEF